MPFLMPYHVERGKMMVRERFGPISANEERIANAIELTRFPVPDGDVTRPQTPKLAWSGPAI